MDVTIVNRVLDLAVAIQQIPAPTFEEAQRAAFIWDRFTSEGLSDVSIDEVGNVYARLPGQNSGRPLVVSAHTDTVFPASVDLHVVRDSETIAGPGIGDNSLGAAGLFGLLWALRQREQNQNRSPLPGDLWLVANVGEEGLGNLGGMRAIVNRFESEPLAYIILEGMALGQIYHRGLGVQRYRITVTTHGGHSWVDFGRPSAIHVLAQVINHLTGLPLPRSPRTTLNVGVISGGTSVNTIAGQATLELDLRSEGIQTLNTLVTNVETLVEAANRPGIQVTAKITGQRPAGEISISHPLVRLSAHCLELLGVTPHYNIGSTDANIPLSRGLPAVCLGLTRGCGAHTANENIQIQPVATGLEQVHNIVKRAYREL